MLVTLSFMQFPTAVRSVECELQWGESPAREVEKLSEYGGAGRPSMPELAYENFGCGRKTIQNNEGQNNIVLR